ncbi:MAG: hypothetical protein Q9182_006102 [Xanthomendoza sp. 2 TL-2023]
MTSANSPVPIILCGAKISLGQESANFMNPEFEVIHFCVSVDAACAEIPPLLLGEEPKPAEGNEVGTHNYSTLPKAVLFGRTYTNDKLQAVLDACKGKGEISWVIPGEAADKNEVIGPGHATKVATNMKTVLTELVNTGKMGQEGHFKYSF